MNCKKIKTSNEGPTMIKDSGDVAHISIRKGSESTRDGNTNESKSNEENFVNSNFSFEPVTSPTKEDKHVYIQHVYPKRCVKAT